MTKALLVTAEDEIREIEIPDTHALYELQTMVGGLIDCVRNDDLVGYVNDEGLLMGLPLNGWASLMLGQPLVGDVVIVGGYNKAGYYDGENHDIPEWFAQLARAIVEVNNLDTPLV